MELELKYKCVAGTDRGGEDVSLSVVLTSETEPTSETVEEEAAQAFENWKASFLELCKEDGEEDLNGEDLLTDGDPPNGVVLTSDGFVRTFESSYGFRVNKPESVVKADVVKLAADQFPEVEWKFGKKSRLWTIERNFYKVGNAE